MQYEIKATIRVSPWIVSDLMSKLSDINSRLMYSYDGNLLEVHEFGITQNQLQQYTTLLFQHGVIVKIKVKQY